MALMEILMVILLGLSVVFALVRLIQSDQNTKPWVGWAMWYCLALACAIRFVILTGSVTLLR